MKRMDIYNKIMKQLDMEIEIVQGLYFAYDDLLSMIEVVHEDFFKGKRTSYEFNFMCYIAPFLRDFFKKLTFSKEVQTLITNIPIEVIFFLHELGHFSDPNKDTWEDDDEAIDTLDELYQYEYRTIEYQTAYRYIPSEHVADMFAVRMLETHTDFFKQIIKEMGEDNIE